MKKLEVAREAFASVRANVLVSALRKIEKFSYFESQADLFPSALALVVFIVRLDPAMDSEQFDLVFKRLEKSSGTSCAGEFESAYLSCVEIDLATEADKFKSADVATKENFYSILFDLAVADGFCSKKEREALCEIANSFDLDDVRIRRVEKSVSAVKTRSQRMVRSGMGLLAAVFILGIFIFTATFLKSVLFGIVLADLFLPLQRFYQKQLSESRFLRKGEIILNKILAKFSKSLDFLPAILRLKKMTETEKRVRKKERLRSRSVYLTVFTAILSFLVLLGSIFWVTFHYGAKATDAIGERANRKVVKSSDSPMVIKEGEEIASLDDQSAIKDSMSEGSSNSVEVNRIEINGAGSFESGSTDLVDEEVVEAEPGMVSEWRAKLESFVDEHFSSIQEYPEFQSAVDRLQEYMEIASNREEIFKKAASYSVAIFKKTGDVLGGTVDFLLNVMLSLFFFSFFLRRMSSFEFGGKSRETLGVYLVKSIFSSSWMPATTSQTQKDAADILDTVVGKLQKWLKGHSHIIAIESCIYVLVFALLGVPYAIPVGIIAGCGILIPFLGAIISFTLTVLVIYAAGAFSPFLVIQVLCVYMIVNLLLEQFFLYPLFVGEALGLTLVETIIVVILGGMWAGVLGVILAAPVASVIKYLIPRIYDAFKREIPVGEMKE